MSQLSTPCHFHILHPTLPRSFSKRLFVNFIDLSSSVRCNNPVIPLWCLFNEEKLRSHKIAFLSIVMLSSANLPWCNVEILICRKEWFVALVFSIIPEIIVLKRFNVLLFGFWTSKHLLFAQDEILWMKSQSAHLNHKSHLVLLFFYLFILI